MKIFRSTTFTAVHPWDCPKADLAKFYDSTVREGTVSPADGADCFVTVAYWANRAFIDEDRMTCAGRMAAG
jgi:hypothetical protein